MRELVAELDALPQPPGLVVVDTLARAFAGADENSTKDMGAFVAACDELKARYRCAVMVLHHSGHGDKNRARGSSALKASLDHEYGLSRDAGGAICLQCWKSKDAEPPQPLGFALEGVALDWADDEGNPQFSAVPVPAELSAAQPDTCTPNGTWPPKALEILCQLFQHHRANLEAAGLDPEGARVSAQDWRKACESQGIPRQRVYEAIASLKQHGFIGREGDYVYLPA